MKKLLTSCLLAIALAFALPLVLLRAAPPAATAKPESTPEQAGNLGESAVLPENALSDGRMELRVLTDAGVETMSMARYLPMALAGEMPASFNAEALKAQAVALRTYALYLCQNPKSAHPEADICTSGGCCAAGFDEQTLRQNWGESFESYYAAVLSAVQATDGQYLCWEQQPILAVFHSCSSGRTEASGNVWSSLPYLQSVSSPETEEDVRTLVTSVELSPEDFKTTVLRSFPAAQFGPDPAQWLGETKLNSAGRVSSMLIAEQEISGLALRSLFSLRSTDFSLSWTGSAFVFTVSGYGHGVGMSQYGANVLALQGWDYGQILQHYYPGAELVVAVLNQ